MAAEQIKSQSITNLDAQPIVPNSAAQGASGRQATIDDFAVCSATPLQSTKSFYRLIRLPWYVFVKSVVIATDVGLDSGTHALVMDFNVAWSDSTKDGTPPGLLPSSATEAVIPTTANDGATNTTIAAYASPNKIFGSQTMSAAGAALTPTNIIFNGITATYTMAKIVQQPMYQTFGFVDGRGNPVDPGGNWDLLAYVSTAAGTGVAGNLYARIEFSI